MWFVAVLMFVVLFFVVYIICEYFEWDNYYNFRTIFTMLTCFFLIACSFLQGMESICEATQASSVIPYKIIRDTSNKYYVINEKMDKEYIKNVKLIEDGVSVVETVKYKQSFWLLDWTLFDFEEKTLYVNVNDKVEIVY